MDVIFDWDLGNMIYNGLITLRLCGFPFAEIRSFQNDNLAHAQSEHRKTCAVLLLTSRADYMAPSS